MDHVRQGKLSITSVVDACCHQPSLLFGIKNRGFIREGYYADLVLVDPDKEQQVTKSQLEYACKWSPMEGHLFRHPFLMYL